MVKRISLLILLGAAVALMAGRPAFAGDNRKLTVVAVVYAKPGLEKQVERELLKLVPLTRKEPGCLQYDMHVNIDLDTLKINPGMYLFYENWRSREDWDIHMKMPYLKKWFDMAPDVTEKIDLTIWKMKEVNTNPTFRGKSIPNPEERFSLMAQLHIKPEYVDAAHKEMLSLIPLTHAESGCINYTMHINLNMETMAPKPAKVLFYENWYDYKIWKTEHMKAPYLVNWFEKAPNMTDKIELTGWHLLNFSENYEPVEWKSLMDSDE
jgi:quinol monooxygenase YgiN